MLGGNPFPVLGRVKIEGIKRVAPIVASALPVSLTTGANFSDQQASPPQITRTHAIQLANNVYFLNILVSVTTPLTANNSYTVASKIKIDGKPVRSVTSMSVANNSNEKVAMYALMNQSTDGGILVLVNKDAIGNGWLIFSGIVETQ